MFNNIPRSYWKDLKHQRELFDNIAKTLKIQKPEDWYTVRVADVCDLGARSVLTFYYQTSLIKGTSQ
jgi:hypothetical protein